MCLSVAPQVTVPHREVSQQVGATTIMTCLVLTNPVGTFSWLREGERLIDDDKYELANWTVGEYQYMVAATIHDLALSDYGAYQCVAANNLGRSEGDMSIFGMPSFLKPCVIWQINRCLIKSCTIQIMFYAVTFHPLQPFLRITLSGHELMIAKSQIVPYALWTIILSYKCCIITFTDILSCSLAFY